MCDVEDVAGGSGRPWPLARVFSSPSHWDRSRFNWSIGGHTSLGTSRLVSGISSGLMVPGEGVAGTNRPSRVRRALVALGALRGLVTPAGNLPVLRGVV